MRPSQVSTNISDWQIAEKMMQMGMRPPLVSATTRLPLTVLRNLWQSIHGKRPPSGLLPDNSLGLLRRYRHVVHGNLFFSIYFKMAGESIFKTANNATILAAYETYLEMVKQMEMVPLIELTAAWYIARDLRSQILEKHYCRKCKVPYLYSLQLDLTHHCPFCNLHRRPERLRSKRSASEDLHLNTH